MGQKHSKEGQRGSNLWSKKRNEPAKGAAIPLRPPQLVRQQDFPPKRCLLRGLRERRNHLLPLLTHQGAGYGDDY